jgi:GTP-binding protein
MSSVVKISGARFIKGAAKATQFPDWDLPEIAFGGRSNVGKSSLLRVLAGSRRLVRVSRTPGRTQEVNFFQLRLDDTDCAFVDLPGYGYAKVPGRIKHRWGQVVEQYFAERAQLAALVLLIDARRLPEDAERELFAYLQELDRPCLPVYTKVDKLPKTRRDNLLWRSHEALGARGRPLGFSALSGAGTEAVLEQLQSLVRQQLERMAGPPLILPPGELR